MHCFLALLLITASAASPESSADELRRLATANNDLALRMHRQLSAESSDNIFFSPLSLSTVLGMLYYGTKGETAKELRSVLGYERAGLTDDQVHRSLSRYLTTSLASRDASAYVLKSANGVLLDKSLDSVPSYKRDVRDLYQASVQEVDFARQGPQIVSHINRWVKENTGGKIEKLLDDVDPSTAFVLLNAVYFKGTWKTQFDPSDTDPWIFYNNGREAEMTKVDMMRLTEEFPYAETDHVRVLEMPYKGDNVSMVIVLPVERDGLTSVERSLDSVSLSTLRRRLVKTEVHVTLPKFKLEYSRDLSGDLQALGGRKMFSAGGDFSGIASDGRVSVDQVVHKAALEVNEAGSEAAAVTGLISDRFGDSTPDVTVDRPFLFAIVDTRIDMILFMGHVTHL